MNAASILPWAGLVTGGGALILGLANIAKEWLTGDEGRRAEAGAKRAEGAAKTAETSARKHETWFADFEKAYEMLEKRFEACDQKCERFANALYGLMDDLEEDVMPMLMLPHVDHVETGKAVRACMNKARTRTREAS